MWDGRCYSACPWISPTSFVGAFSLNKLSSSRNMVFACQTSLIWNTNSSRESLLVSRAFESCAHRYPRGCQVCSSWLPTAARLLRQQRLPRRYNRKSHRSLSSSSPAMVSCHTGRFSWHYPPPYIFATLRKLLLIKIVIK